MTDSILVNLVADESADADIVDGLRLKGFEVLAISETSPSIKDSAVLEIAYTKEALLITEDKDFGELVMRLKMSHKGILLIRLSGILPGEKAAIVINAVSNHSSQLQNSFSVLDSKKLRIKLHKSNRTNPA